MNNFKIKLFDELVINEFDLSTIISNYIFPIPHYEGELKRIGQDVPSDPIEFKNKIIEHKENINFRTKNIIFVGYSKKENNKYFFLQLTTKKSEKRRQSLYFEHNKGHKVYINTNRIFYFNFHIQKVWLSKFNTDKSRIKQNSYWKSDLLNSMNLKTLKSLATRTNLDLYKNKLIEYDILKSIDDLV